MRMRFDSSWVAGLVAGAAFASTGCVAPQGGPSTLEVCSAPVTAPTGTYTEDLSAARVLYYPKDGTRNPGYCPKASPAPPGTHYHLVSAKMNYVWVGGTSVDVNSQVLQANAASCAGRELVLEGQDGGGIGPSFNVPAPRIADGIDFPGSADGYNSYGMQNLELDFNVTLPPDVDPAQTPFSYSLYLTPNYDAAHDVYTGYTLPAAGIPPLTPHPGDCQADFPPAGAPTQEVLAVSQSLTTTNANCQGVPALQAWPSGAQLTVTGAAIVTMGSQVVQVADVMAASPVSIDATGSFSMSVTLADPVTISAPAQVTDLMIPVQFAGVAALNGESLLLDVGGPSLSVTYGTDAQGNVDQSQIIAAFTFNPSAPTYVPMSASAAPLCPGAPCLDGSAVVQCNMMYCAYSLGTGSPGSAAAAQGPKATGKASCSSGGSCGGGPTFAYSQPVCASQCPSGSLCTVNDSPQPSYSGVGPWIY